MKVTVEIRQSNYAPIVERFASKRDALNYCAEPWNVAPIGGERHSRHYFPVWGGSLEVIVWAGTFEDDDLCDRYPDWSLEIGPRGGMRFTPC